MWLAPGLEFVRVPGGVEAQPVDVWRASADSAPSRLSNEWFSIITTIRWSNGISPFDGSRRLVRERQAAGLARRRERGDDAGVPVIACEGSRLSRAASAAR